jgi:methylenetetrahydrofolate reductase (NADPH)
MRLTHRLAELEARGDVNAFSFGCFLPDSEVGIQRLKARLEALCQLEPAFISISGLGTLDYAAACIPLAQHVAKVMGIPAILHISLPPVAPAAELLQTLELLKVHGLRNVVLSDLGVSAADADATAGTSTDGAAAHASAATHVSEIKRAFGDYFCLGLAAVASISHVAQLKAAQDAGIEFVVLQHSYDSKALLRHGEEAFRAGVTVPLIPSLLMHGSQQTLLQINDACGVPLPADLRALAAAPPDAVAGSAADELTLRDRVNAVLLAEAAGLYTCGARVLHLLTLNLEAPARRLLRDLGLVGPGAPSRRRLPWRPSADEARAFEDVRPIFWANRPASYVERTSSWETFPSGACVRAGFRGELESFLPGACVQG